MVQAPAVRMVTVLPLTVQTDSVWLLKLTVRPEVAVAATTKDPSLKVKGPTAGKVIVWLAWLIVMFWSTFGAGPYSAFPAWDARMVQGPAARMVTELPLTVQTSGVSLAKLTASPDVAVAATVKAGSPKS